MAVHLVLPGAGVGTRFNAPVAKQHIKIQNMTLLEWTFRAWQFWFDEKSPQDKVVLVVSPKDQLSRSIAGHYPDIELVDGGDERSSSVLNALNYLSGTASPEDWVMVHDVARPCVRRQDIEALLTACRQKDVGGLLATPVTDTVKIKHDNGQIETIDRSLLWSAQTPQCFKLGELRKALDSTLTAADIVTDEASAMEKYGFPVQIIEGSVENIKMTHPQDLEIISQQLTRKVL